MNPITSQQSSLMIAAKLCSGLNSLPDGNFAPISVRRQFDSLLTGLKPSRILIMQLANNTIHQTHYNILNIKEDATREEIRSNYKSALLTSHPDKLQNTSQTTNPRFLEIQKAWEILGDMKSRAMYDMELRVSRQEDAIADEIEVEDMVVEDGGDVVELFYQCRCGDYFEIDSLELGEMGFRLLMEGDKMLLQAVDSADVASVVLPCGSCSLKICLVINKDFCP